MTAAISDTNPASSIYAGLNGSSSKSTASSTNAAQSRFLTMLTAQLKNQDPLNPVDNAQMTSQMAQISTVDGIERLNTTLQTMLGNSNDSQMLQAASMVGHQVLVPGTALSLKSGRAVAGVDLSGAADQVTVNIKDGNGLVVRTLTMGEMESGSHLIGWDGKTNGGTDAADGQYTISVAATQGGNSVTATALAVGAVASVDRTATGLNFNVSGLGTFTVADIRQLF